MKHIIVATDGSTGANRAVEMAARLAKAIGADLMILPVGGAITGAELRQLADADGDLGKTLTSAATQLLERARKRAQRTGLAAVKVQCEWGDPAETIVDTVRREKADILVVGRGGRGRLTALLLGSVSQKLASLAPCPVMVVP